MTQQIEVLKQTELLGRQFEVYGTPAEPYFLAKEVAQIIEHSNHRMMLEGVDDDEKGVSIAYTPGGPQKMWFLTENGLYEVLMQSRKPIAKQFKKGVKAILKEIRTTGGYLATQAEDTPELIMARALQVAQSTIERHANQLKAANETIAEQQEEIKALKRDSDYLNTILNSKGTVTTTQIAQDYGYSARSFNARLKEMHIHHKVNGQWILYAPYIGKGFVQSKTISFLHKDGRQDTKMHTEWTQRGRLFLYDALREVGVLPLIER